MVKPISFCYLEMSCFIFITERYFCWFQNSRLLVIFSKHFEVVFQRILVCVAIEKPAINLISSPSQVISLFWLLLASYVRLLYSASLTMMCPGIHFFLPIQLGNLLDFLHLFYVFHQFWKILSYYFFNIAILSFYLFSPAISD